MKITSGIYKGIPLFTPRGIDVRPTLAKVRSAIFNMMRPYIEDTICFDFFSGTGALGFEALSNGAAKIIFIDKDHKDIIFKNAGSLKIHKEKFEIIQTDYRQAIYILKRKAIKADIIFADPPYNKGHIKNLLKLLKINDNLNNALIMIELHRKERKDCGEALMEWEVLREKEYGETILLLLKNKSGG